MKIALKDTAASGLDLEIPRLPPKVHRHAETRSAAPRSDDGVPGDAESEATVALPSTTDDHELVELTEVADQAFTVNRLGFADLVEVSGTIDTRRNGVLLDGLVARSLRVSTLEWTLPGGALQLGKPATAEAVAVDFRFPDNPQEPPLIGEARAQLLAAEALSVVTDGLRLSADAQLERVAFAMSAPENGSDTAADSASEQPHGPSSGRFGAASLTLKNLQVSVGEILVRVGAVTLSSVAIGWRPDELTVEAASAQASGIVVHHRNIELEIDDLALPRGLVVRGGGWSVGELIIGECRLVVHEVLGPPKAAPPAPARTSRPVRTVTAPPEPGRVDLRILDQLNGQLDVDLTVDATVPVIGRRKATHHFRVPISDGTINYRSLERDLSTLEDAIIDIEVRDGKLALERGLPIIGIHKPILLWDLSDVELALAKKRIVRLRTLPNFRPAEPAKKDSKSSFAVRRLDFDNIDVKLTMPTEAQPPLGGVITRALLGELTIKGDVRYDANARLDITGLAFTAQSADLAIDGLQIARQRLSAAQILLGSLDQATLSFEQLRPRTFMATLRDLKVVDVSMAPDTHTT